MKDDTGQIEKADGKQIKSPQAKEKQIVEQAWAIADPVCIDEGMELVFIEYRREAQGRVLRIYIDKQGGVTVDDCVQISRQMSDIFDATLKDIGPYSLEVSSPGINRPLGRREDFDRFSGEKVHIKTRRAINGRKNYKGILRGIDKGVVTVCCDDEEISISLKEISIARLVNFNGEK